jgi:sensor histidine kinase YesM
VLTVQPLVENAIRHGVAALPGPGRVELTASVEDGVLRVSVQDTGRGFQPDETAAGSGMGNGVALDNVRRRLELHYGSRARLRMENNAIGALAVLEAPVDTSKEPAQPPQVAVYGKR